MAWVQTGDSHYLNQCWLSSLMNIYISHRLYDWLTSIDSSWNENSEIKDWILVHVLDFWLTVHWLFEYHFHFSFGFEYHFLLKMNWLNWFLCKTLMMFSREWDKELLKKKNGGNPSLRRAIIRTFGVEYALWGAVAFMEVHISFVLFSLKVHISYCYSFSANTAEMFEDLKKKKDMGGNESCSPTKKKNSFGIVNELIVNCMILSCKSNKKKSFYLSIGQFCHFWIFFIFLKFFNSAHKWLHFMSFRKPRRYYSHWCWELWFVTSHPGAMFPRVMRTCLRVGSACVPWYWRYPITPTSIGYSV